MTDILQTYHVLGLTVGLCTFLIIGIFHPIVVKCEYYFGKQCWWWFLLLGTLTLILSIIIEDMFLSVLAGVTAFSSFWTIKEIFEQEQRVKKGWFPRNPKRRYPWD